MEAKRLILETNAAGHREQAILTTDVLKEITYRLVKAFAPEKIFLFGSYAYGQPNDDSDVDVLIVVKDSDQPRYRRARKAYAALRGIKIPTDVIVMTQDEFQKKSTVKSSLVSQAIHEGKLLYGT
jgi:predicted nucleotidyltransferase